MRFRQMPCRCPVHWCAASPQADRRVRPLSFSARGTSPLWPARPGHEKLRSTDDYQIPTTDGRYVTLSYDEESRQAVISFPPAPNEDEARSGYGFTPDDAARFADGLAAIRARMAGGASGGVSAD